jgi:hypothetical protein
MTKARIQYPGTIVNAKGNNGWHPKGKRAYKKAVTTLTNCLRSYAEPRLYHLCFEGQTHRKQMEMLNALVQIADRAGIKCEWFACREIADTTKLAHIHCFVVIDAKGIRVAKVFNQFDDGPVAQLCAKHGVNFYIFRPRDVGLHGLNRYMALPYQGPGNRQTARAQKRLADALVWLSYLGKARSKPTDDEADGQLFPASRPNRKRQPAAQAGAVETIQQPENLPSPPSSGTQTTQTQETEHEAIATSQRTEANPYRLPGDSDRQAPIQAHQSPSSPRSGAPDASSSPGTSASRGPASADKAGADTDSQQQTCAGRAGPRDRVREAPSKPNPDLTLSTKGQPAMNALTPALAAVAHKYLNGLYQQYVDAGLNLQQMQARLTAKGINKPLRTIKHDLDNVFCYAGYADAHPAPAAPDVAAFDRMVRSVPTGRVSSLKAFTVSAQC